MKTPASMAEELPTRESGAPAGYFPIPHLEEREFDLFRSLIHKCCGIRLADTKRLLVQNRVGKRLRALGFTSFTKYYRYVRTPEGEKNELANLLNVITTNQTHFFREPHHFQILQQKILPEIQKRHARGQPLRVWSAGCSTGQEPYTLAMVIDDWLGGAAIPGFRVVASDIDYQVLATAEAARYPNSSLSEIPAKYLSRYVDVRGEDIGIKPQVRKRVTFRRQNLSEIQPARPRFDVIFCRNVIMYLHPETRYRLAEVFYESLVDGGYLIVGSAESLRERPGALVARQFARTLTYQRPATPQRRTAHV